MSMSDVQPIILGALLLIPAVLVGILLLTHARELSMGNSMLEHWAQREGLRLLRREECWFFRGPFFWSTSDGQRVYRVTVQDPEGRVGNGYVRCGGYWRGLFTDQVEARWDN
jgi:hypothetical protein